MSSPSPRCRGATVGTTPAMQPTCTHGSTVIYHNLLVIGVLMQSCSNGQVMHVHMHGKTARFSAKCVRQWDVVFGRTFSGSFVTFRLGWYSDFVGHSCILYIYCITPLLFLTPQSLLVDQRTWPFPPLNRTVSLSPGTHP